MNKALAILILSVASAFAQRADKIVVRTVAEMVSTVDPRLYLTNVTVETLGFNSVNDGSGATYVSTNTITGTNTTTRIASTLRSGFSWEKIAGASGVTLDDVKAAIDTADELAAILGAGDYTGTGAFARGTSPTLSAPIISSVEGSKVLVSSSGKEVQSLSNSIAFPLVNATDVFEMEAPVNETLVEQTEDGAETVINNASVFSGWITPCGSPQNFSRVKVKVYPFDSADPVTQIRVVLYEGSYTGTVVFDETVTQSTVVNAVNTVVVDSDSVVANASDTNLVIGVFCNGKTGMISIGGTVYSTPQRRYVTSGLTTVTTSVAADSHHAQWAAFYSTSEGAEELRPVDGFDEWLFEHSALRYAFDPVYTFTAVDQLGTYSLSFVGNTNSTFSGWGSPVGPKQNFDTVGVYIYSWDETDPVTQIRLRVRETDRTGTILADATQSISPTVGSEYLATVSLGTTVANSGAANLWVEYFTDGKTGVRLLNSGQIQYASPPQLHYWTDGSVTTISAGSDTVTHGNIYMEFGTLSDRVSELLLKEAIKSQVGAPNIIDAAYVLTPRTLKWAIGGQVAEQNLYFDNFIYATVPVNQLIVDVVSNRGSQYADFWRWSPTSADAGSYAVSVKVAKGESVMVNQPFTLTIRHATNTVSAGVPTTNQLIVVSDSTYNTGREAAELVRHDSGDTNWTLAQIGTVTATKSDSTGTSRSVAHEARSGWTISQFYSDASSPFVTGGSFSFNYYLTNNSYSSFTNNGIIVFRLGINDFFSYTDSTNLTQKITAELVKLDAMIADIHAVKSTIKCVVMPPLPPAPTQDAFAVSYSSGQTRPRYMLNYLTWCKALRDRYDTSDQNTLNTFYLPGHFNIDVAHGYTVQTMQANARSSQVIAIYNNGVHPGEEADYQSADAMYALLKGLF